MKNNRKQLKAMKEKRDRQQAETQRKGARTAAQNCPRGEQTQQKRARSAVGELYKLAGAAWRAPHGGRRMEGASPLLGCIFSVAVAVRTTAAAATASCEHMVRNSGPGERNRGRRDTGTGVRRPDVKTSHSQPASPKPAPASS